VDEDQDFRLKYWLTKKVCANQTATFSSSIIPPRIFSRPGYTLLAKLNQKVSKDAQTRIKWFDYYRPRGENARLTCCYFGISPLTFYRWKKRYNPMNPQTIEGRSHRPKRLRHATYSSQQVESVLKLREAFPRWGQDKIKVLLEKQRIGYSGLPGRSNLRTQSRPHVETKLNKRCLFRKITQGL
jgi:hypothetical protein